MPTLEELNLERWRSGDHIGEATPRFYMTIRRGKFVRGYSAWVGDDVDAYIPTHSKPWQATWTPTGPWKDVPNVFDVAIDQSFDNNGIASATIQIENVNLEPTGPGGLWHKIVRGFLSPLRGYQGAGRPAIAEKNEWFNVFKRKSQVMIAAGYGQAFVPVFTGLINDVDLTSAPDRITCTVRDFGQTLTDQRLFGTVKDNGLTDPITFAPGRKADLDDTKKVGGAASASSEEHNHPARLVCDSSDSSRWLSDGHGADNVTEWVQIHVPRGRYLTFYMQPEFAGMEVYISVFARDRDLGKKAQVDDVDVDSGWVDVGKGDVPGANGGFPFIKKATAPGAGKYWTFGHQLELGKDSVVRISFRKLGKHRSLVPGHEGEVQYRAGVSRLFAVSRKQNEKKAAGKKILIADVADMVKVVLRWAGFKEWDIESVGTSLKEPVTFDANTTLMDVIAKVQEVTNYVFYIRPPEDIEQIGIPVFRNPRALDTSFTDPFDVIEIKDSKLLTAISARFTDANMPAVIRVRGKKAKKKQGGVTLGSDKVRRYQYLYSPPWKDDMAGIVKHVTFTNEDLASEFECQIASLLIAVSAAMKSALASFEIPHYPYFFLDSKVAVVDEGTGLSTRIYIAQRQVSLHSGEQASAKMTLSGAIIDTPEFEAVRADLFAALTADRSPTVIASHQTRTTGSRDLAPVKTSSGPVVR